MPIDRGFGSPARPPVRSMFRAPAPPPRLAPKVRPNLAAKPKANGIGDIFSRLAATAASFGFGVPSAMGAAQRAVGLVNPSMNTPASPYFTPQILPRINIPFQANPQLNINIPQGWNYGKTWGLPPVPYRDPNRTW